MRKAPIRRFFRLVSHVCEFLLALVIAQFIPFAGAMCAYGYVETLVDPEARFSLDDRERWGLGILATLYHILFWYMIIRFLILRQL